MHAFASRRDPRPGRLRPAVCAALATTLFTLAALAPAAPARAERVWLGEKGSLSIAPIVVYETFDSFYMGEEEVAYPPGRYKQATALAAIDYAVLDGVSLDLTLGYVNGFGEPQPNNGGLYDTTLGVTVELLDEFEWDSAWVPTLTLRVGGIIAGTYDADGTRFPGIPGDKASGFESELAAGRLLPCDIGVTGALGIRARAKNVPIDWHVRLSTFKSFFDVVSVNVAYDQWLSISGLDIGGPGFTPDRFRELRENSGNVEVGLGVHGPWDLDWTVYYARTVMGRNTGIKDVVGVAVGVPFDFGSGR